MQRNPKTAIHQPGFTLVELLVVIAIIATLTVVGFSASRSIRAKANAATSASNIKQLYTGHQLYLSEYGFFPSGNDWTSKVTAESDAGCRTWHERIAPYIGLGTDLDQTQIQFNKKKLPPSVFLVPGRKRLVEDNGGTGGGFRSGYIRSGKIYVNDADVASGRSFKTLTRFDRMGASFFLIDLGGDSPRTDFNGWQIDAASRLKWPAHGGEAGKLDGSVVACFFDGHVEVRKRSELPVNWQDVFWNPVIN